MKKGPFKMKGMDFGVSPVKQDPKKTFDRIKKMKDKAKKFVKSLNVKKVTKTAGKANLLSLALSPKSASANTTTPPPPLSEYKSGRGETIK
jgi:hypothetical protein